MSKQKYDNIQKVYKEKYVCGKGHPIQWIGSEKIYATDLDCEKCKANSEIRWKCTTCNTYFCAKCYKLILGNYCPQKHKYNLANQFSNLGYSGYTCDVCFEKFKIDGQTIYDKICNITLCPPCFNKSFDIPEVLED